MSQSFKILELKATYTQEPDGCQADQLGQYLDVRTEDAGGGHFLILETKRWAINSPAELQELLADFIGRGAGMGLEWMPARAGEADVVEPIATHRDYSLGLPEACSRTYLCDACGHDGGLAFDECTQPGCKGMYLTDKPAPAPDTVSKLSELAAPSGLEEWARSSEPILTPVAAPEVAPITRVDEAPSTDLNSKGKGWTTGDTLLLKQLFPTTSNKVIAERLGRVTNAIVQKAGKLGLKKARAAAPAATPATIPMLRPAKLITPAAGLDQDAHERITKAVRELGGVVLARADATAKTRALGLLSKYSGLLSEVPGASQLYGALVAER